MSVVFGGDFGGGFGGLIFVVSGLVLIWVYNKLDFNIKLQNYESYQVTVTNLPKTQNTIFAFWKSQIFNLF